MRSTLPNAVTVLGVCIPTKGRCLWLRPALHGRSILWQVRAWVTLSVWKIEYIWKSQIFSFMVRNYHLQWNVQIVKYRIWLKAEAYLVALFCLEKQGIGEKRFSSTLSSKTFPLVSGFPKQKTLFLRQTCPAFSQVRDVGLLHFGCPKTNFQSSKFHEISNLKNEKFDQNMPYGRAFGVCMVLRTTKSLNLCGFRVRC